MYKMIEVKKLRWHECMVRFLNTENVRVSFMSKDRVKLKPDNPTR
jgi:hypothetical protein